ncbi:unnamed protein product, partial [Closterium sp. Naga37s-1]
CMPLHDFPFTYRYLMAENQSLLHSACNNDWNCMGHYSSRMQPHVQRSQWTKGSQWWALTWHHAFLAATDTTIYPTLARWCKVSTGEWGGVCVDTCACGKERTHMGDVKATGHAEEARGQLGAGAEEARKATQAKMEQGRQGLSETGQQMKDTSGRAAETAREKSAQAGDVAGRKMEETKQGASEGLGRAQESAQKTWEQTKESTAQATEQAKRGNIVFRSYAPRVARRRRSPAARKVQSGLVMTEADILPVTLFHTAKTALNDCTGLAMSTSDFE